MSTIRVLNSGIIYQNSKPHLRSIHAYFPSVVRLPNGEMLATIALGEAFEAIDLHTETFRSIDGGITWRSEGRLLPELPGRLTSDCSRISIAPDGDIIAFSIRFDRSEHPDEGFVNETTIGFVETELLLSRSDDGGITWTNPQAIEPPLRGPAFELCSPILFLDDDNWLLPTSTWRGWDGECPNGMKMVALASHDAGAHWPEYVDVMADQDNRLIFWESKIVRLADGRLLAAAWAYDESKGKDLPNHFTLCDDEGSNWTSPQSTGLLGQTLTPFALAGNRILSIYRRTDSPGLWANLSHIDGSRWINDEAVPLWGATDAKRSADEYSGMAETFQSLRFGAPCATSMPDGEVYVAFWCYEDNISVIRWFRISAE